MKELLKSGNISYYKIENAREVDKLEIPEEEGGFDFFHGLGIVGYDLAFKMWLRRFPRPVLIVAMKETLVLGWVYVEEWTESAYNGMPVYVLRAIEVHPELRKKGIGRMLLLLALKEVNGYMITKPLTREGSSFFRKAGFKSKDDFMNPPLDLSKQPNYVILPPYIREKMVEELKNLKKKK